MVTNKKRVYGKMEKESNGYYDKQNFNKNKF